MEVILKEDVAKLGARGEVVNVAEGYGRNYLLPKKLAVEATSANKAVIEQMKAAAVRKLAKEKGDAELLAKQFDGVSLHIIRKAGEHDALFGSVTSADIAHAFDWQMIARGRKILADSENIHFASGEIAADLQQLFHIFAQSDHDSGLRDRFGREFFGARE